MIFHHAQRYELFSTIPNVCSDYLEDFTTFFAYRINKEIPFSTFDVTAVESNVKKLTSNVSAVESNVEKLESNVISANAISQTKSILSRKRKKREMEFDDESGETRCRSIGWLRWSKKGLPKKVVASFSPNVKR